jgi:hypothetical protein
MRTFATVLLSLALVLVPIQALAQKPVIILQPNPGPLLALTEPFCGFNAIDQVAPGTPYKERLIQFANGGALIAGPLKVQSQNLTTGQIIDINSSGPAPSIAFLPDGSTVEVATGPSLWNIPPPPLAVTEAAEHLSGTRIRAERAQSCRRNLIAYVSYRQADARSFFLSGACFACRFCKQMVSSQQNQQLDLVGGCNTFKSRDLEIWGRVRSPPPLPKVLVESVAFASREPQIGA